MYMAGRRRTASRPSSTLILVESYVVEDILVNSCSRSNPHRHDDVAVIVGFLAAGPHFAGAVRIFEQKADLRGGHRSQKIEHVLGVESDLRGRSVKLRWNTLFALAGFRNRRMDLDLARSRAEADGSRPLVRELSPI